MRLIVLAATLCLLAPAVLAHSQATATDPGDGAVLAEAPGEVALSFTNSIRLTRIELTHMDQSPVALDLGDQQNFETRFVVPIVDRGTGTYTISWRGLSGDGHVMRGEFSFRVE